MIDLGADGVSPNVLWRTGAESTERRNDSLHAIMCSPIVTEDCIYGVGSYGEMRCLDTKTGKIVWETHDATGRDRWWNAFLVPHDDRVVISMSRATSSSPNSPATATKNSAARK